MNGTSDLIEIEEIVVEGLDVTADRVERIRGLIEIMLPQRLNEEGLLDRLAEGEIVLAPPPPLEQDLSSLTDAEIAEIVVEQIVDPLREAAAAAETEEDDEDA
jgi:hypothetical protein